jgi:hypothetical protein
MQAEPGFGSGLASGAPPRFVLDLVPGQVIAAISWHRTE